MTKSSQSVDSQAPRVAAASVSAHIRLHVKSLDGTPQVIEFADVTESEAIRRTVSRGMRVLSIESVTDYDKAISSRRTHFPLLLFSQELLALLEAGLNLTEALSTLHTKERHTGVHAVLGSLLASLREGKSFSDVLATFPEHFPDVYVATARASERTGDLPQALTRYIAYQLQFDVIRKKLISAAIYPVMLLVVGGFVTLFLLGYVVPRFATVYESSGREMPWLSAMLLSFGKIIYGHWELTGLGLLVFFVVLGWLVSRAEGRLFMINQVLRLPWFATKANEFRLARFYRAVSLLLASGISLSRAMGMVTGMLAPVEQIRLTQCRLSVEQGQSLSAALLSAGLASPVAESLIKVGERSGQMAEMLERTARFQDEEFARWVDWASRLLEPILMTVIGLVIGTVVVLMYMPIFDLAGSLQ
ncbi:MAG: putative secretion system protein GspF-like [Rhodocyclales bacterium]|nr:putative secretion system protein GspF-like [Rhodocyclales bacterium]